MSIQVLADRVRRERRDKALAGWRATGIAADRRKLLERRGIAGWFARFDAARVISWDANGNRLLGKAENIRNQKYDL